MTNEINISKQITELTEDLKKELGAPALPLLVICFSLIQSVANENNLAACMILLDEMCHLAEVMGIDVDKFHSYYNKYSLLKMNEFMLHVQAEDSTVN